MISESIEIEHRDGLCSNRKWTKANKSSNLIKPKSSISGPLYFDEFICY